ncbi:Exocyst complex component 2 [Pitangus sulphuratus]|nr:Exocyst complex component 2 [Pitangus sulphuratus]
MSRARQPPLVTGISPNEGISWTKVTIRGENLGTGPTDLIGLTICGHNCLLTAEWMSASKIVCRVGQAKNDKGDIIVTTKSGGKGTSTVSFKLLKPEKIGILDQSAVWVDEMNYYDMRTDRNKGIPPLSLRPANPLGIEIDNFDQLKTAVVNLKKQANKKNEGSLAYVKGGLSTFFEAQDALSAIHQKLEADGTEKVEGSMTQKLENVLNRASNTADTLFQEVLGRKDKADSTRNALNVLQRFKFLFNLPLNIERNIQKGDYDVVINDYEKAKSLFGKTEVQVFKKYYAEVETRIEALRELLLDKLLETPSTLHDQKRYIRKQVFMKKFLDLVCFDVTPLPVLSTYLKKTPINMVVGVPSKKRNEGKAWRYKAPQQVIFVEKLTKLVKMIQEVMHSLVKLIRGALLPFSLREGELRQYGGWEMKSELSGQWLTHVIQTVRLSSESLTALEIPNDMLQIIQDLILDLRVRCIIVTLQHTAEDIVMAVDSSEFCNISQELLEYFIFLPEIEVFSFGLINREDIKRLAEKEDWVVDNEGLTSLPSQFEQCIIHSLQSLKTVLDCKPGEASVFQQQKTQEDVCQLSIGIMQVFIDCLEQLSTKPDGDIDTSHLSVDVSSPDLFGSIHEDSSLSSEQRLLIALSNCRYLERHTFLNIAEHFEKHGFQGVDKITQVSMESLKELDQRLFEMYIEFKADPIVGSLEPGIYAGYFDWKDCLVPTGVRNYLKEALVNIIAVHAEVFTISKDLVPRVMSRVVEAVSEELSRLMQCVSSFSKNGALQAKLEICALRDTVAIYLTPESKSSFKQALEALPQLSSGTDRNKLYFRWQLTEEHSKSLRLVEKMFRLTTTVFLLLVIPLFFFYHQLSNLYGGK